MGALLTTIIGGLVVAAVSSTATYLHGRRAGVRKMETGIYKFHETLQKQIDDAHSSRNMRELIVNAQALVSIRDGFKDQLDDLSKLLNSDMDRLSKFVKGKSVNDLSRQEEEIRDLVGVIHKTWPHKRVQIDAAVTRLFASFGIKVNPRRR